MARLVPKSQAQEELDFYPNALRIATLADEHKAIDIRGYDVRGLTLVADCFIICGASSEPHFKAITRGIRDGMKAIGVSALNVEGEVTGGWFILDYGTIVVHIFREEAREFYDLDGLWGDAPELEFDLES